MVKILWQRTVVRDGWHNAFTDLCLWRGMYWLTFRKGSTHASPDGGIVVMRSVDLKRWQQVAFIKTAGDDRDPKFCPTDNRLYVYFGTWLPKPEGWPDKRGPLVSHVAFSDDGIHWSNPIPAYKHNYWLWRVRYHDGTFYSPAYGWDTSELKYGLFFLDLLVSKDGLEWSRKCRIGGKDHRPNEADIWFQPDGEVWCIARSSRESTHSLFYYSKPPYDRWECIDLKVTLHCPVFCEVDGKLYVAGGRRTDAPWKPQYPPAGNTGIFTVEKGKVNPFLALPTDGDAAYPGLISPEPGRMVISYYSQHAYLSGVVYACSPHSSDIYVAMISLE